MQLTQYERDNLRTKRLAQLHYLRPLHLDRILVEEAKNFIRARFSSSIHMPYSERVRNELTIHLNWFLRELNYAKSKYYWLKNFKVSVRFTKDQILAIDWVNSKGERDCRYLCN